MPRRHINGSFAAGLDAATLRGRASACCASDSSASPVSARSRAQMDAVAKELQAAGATVVDVTAADIDARYRAARGASPAR